MDRLGGRRRRRGARRPKGYLAAALGEADALRPVLDQAQHLEAQALHGGERRGAGRRSGKGGRELVVLGGSVERSFSSPHGPPTPSGGKNAPPPRGRAGGARPTAARTSR